jgi:hypothetical protein
MIKNATNLSKIPLFFHDQLNGLIDFLLLGFRVAVWIFQTIFQILSDNDPHNTVDAGTDGGQLRDDIDAFFLVFDHFLNPPQLAFGSF